MKKLLFIITLSLLVPSAFGQTRINTQNKDNPGYFRSPGFVGISAGYNYHSGDTERDKSIRPHVIGMLNLLQSEYGNLALSLGGTFTAPSGNYEVGDISYKISAKQYTGELGINYMTSSSSINFWLGGGYSYNYVTATAKSFRNAGGAYANYSKDFSDSTGGFFVQAGIEYILTKKGNLGMFFLYKYTSTDRARFDVRGDLDFGGGAQPFANQPSLTLSNTGFLFGVSYHF